MRIDGSWLLCPDGRLRPVVFGAVVDATGTPRVFPLMVDTGADVTVLTSGVYALLRFDAEAQPGAALEGVGGRADTFGVDSPLWLRRETGELVKFNIPIVASAAVDVFGVSVLGRDVLNNLVVIVDRQADVVCLLAGNHRYVIQGP